MGRPERPLDEAATPLNEFARDLRELRSRAGNPSYRELAGTALFAPSVLSSAASGHRLPTLAVTLAFVAACGGDRAAWERRWRRVAATVATVPTFRDERARAVLSLAVSRPAPPAADPPLRPMPRTAATLARPAQLPIGSSVFVGRRQALASAGHVIRQADRTRIPFLISGLVGVGKTALALRLADDVSAEFPDGQLYADLSPRGLGRPSSDGILRGFLQALGVPAPLVPQDATQRIGLYRSLLAQRRLFVLLENAGDERQVRPLLGRSALSQVVVTSRARLLGLESAHRIDLDPFARQESMTLLGRLAGVDRIQAEYAAAQDLAQRCGDLPLAVGIVGRRIAARPEWALADTVELLAHQDRLMDCLSVGDLSVRDRLAAAYQLLPAEGRQTVRQIGFRGSGWATAPGLAAALSLPEYAAGQLLESLVDAGLLTQADEAGCYCVPGLFAAFAAGACRDAVRPVIPLREWRPRRAVSEASCVSGGAARRPPGLISSQPDFDC